MRAVMSPLLCAMLTALLWPRVASAALPPATAGASERSNDGASSSESTRIPKPASEANGGGNEWIWVLPAVRMGGSLSYDIRSSTSERQKMTQQGLVSTLRAATDTYIWEPWFAQVTGMLGVSAVRNTSDNSSGFSGGTTKSVFLTGNGQLRVLPISRFPFEAHFEKSNSRVNNDLIAVEGYSGERVGFTQQYNNNGSNIMFGWDRAAQESESYGRDRQDNWQLSASRQLKNHRFSLAGNHAENLRERTGESTTQSNVTIQHGYTPVSALSIENMANVSRSGFKLLGGESQMDLSQVSSLAFWRPGTIPLTVTGGARFLTAGAESSSGDIDALARTRLRNANLNVGLTYDLSRFTHLSASANANVYETNGDRTNGSNQSVGVNYHPASKKIAGFDYNWGTSASLSNSTGGAGGTSQVGLAFNHGVSRSIEAGEGSYISFDMSQAVSGSRVLKGEEDLLGTSRQLTHGGSVSWNHSKAGGSALVRISASDSRALDGNENYFQLINLQASSNMPTSGYTSWGGSLTIQATRQGGKGIPMLSRDGRLINIPNQGGDKFRTSSGGALTYQNSRLFGVRRLNFMSDLRLNSEALLPMLAGPQDQEMAAWENRLDYFIGRTQLRVHALVARVRLPVFNGAQAAEGRTQVSKSIMFSVTRSFGSL